VATTQSKIKKAVERRLVKLLNEAQDGKEGLQALSLSIKYLAVSAKMDEAEYGSDLEKLNKEGGDDNESEIDP